jgi:hypothetical protein
MAAIALGLLVIIPAMVLCWILESLGIMPEED